MKSSRRVQSSKRQASYGSLHYAENITIIRDFGIDKEKKKLRRRFIIVVDQEIAMGPATIESFKDMQIKDVSD